MIDLLALNQVNFDYIQPINSLKKPTNNLAPHFIPQNDMIGDIKMFKLICDLLWDNQTSQVKIDK